MIYRNSEGYYDPTAGAAIKAVEREKAMMVKANDIILITRNGKTRKLAVLAVTGAVATGCALYDSEMLGSVRIICGGEMFAHPEKVEFCFLNSVDIDFMRTMSDEEASALRREVARVIGVSQETGTAELMLIKGDELAEAETGTDSAALSEALDLADEQAKELIRVKAQADTYKELYETLLSQIIQRGAAS